MEKKFLIRDIKNKSCEQLIKGLYKDICAYVKSKSTCFDKDSKSDFVFLNTMNLNEQKEDIFADVLE